MNVLIVHAHPEPQSLCAALCCVATEHLRAQGHQVRVSDLHVARFNPVASGADFTQRQNPDYLDHVLEQRHACETGTLAVDIQSELAKLLWCDLLILNFPISWCAAPAMLKGWLDRVLVSGLVHGLGPHQDRGGLSPKRVMLSITVEGQAQLFGPDGVHGSLVDMLMPLTRGTLAHIGMSVLPSFVANHAPGASAGEQAHTLADHRRHLDQLDTMRPMHPSL